MNSAYRALSGAAIVAAASAAISGQAAVAADDHKYGPPRPGTPAVVPDEYKYGPASPGTAPAAAPPPAFPFAAAPQPKFAEANDPAAAPAVLHDPFDVTSPSAQDVDLFLRRDDLLIGGRAFEPVATPTMGQNLGQVPVYLAAGEMESEKPNIHGFLEAKFLTAYVTPRGLVVENQGLVFQPIGGVVIPIGDLGEFKRVAVVTGVWNSINSHQDDTNVGPWNEMDYFASVEGKVGPFALALSYGLWSFPQSTEAKPSTEHNIDLKITYDDSAIWGAGGFVLKPYVDLWWAVSGSSTVVLGKEGDTGYVEIGMAPTFKVDAIPNYPISLTFPTYFSVGPEGYWGAENPDGHFGLFSTGVSATVPLNFIPARYGGWTVTAGLTYQYLINDNLLAAGNLLSGNDDRNVFVGFIGIKMGF